MAASKEGGGGVSGEGQSVPWYLNNALCGSWKEMPSHGTFIEDNVHVLVRPVYALYLTIQAVLALCELVSR